MTTNQVYVTTITAIAVHPPDINPAYGEGCITARLDDEVGGPFVVLEQDDQKVRIDFDEVEPLTKAISQLRQQATVIVREALGGDE